MIPRLYEAVLRLSIRDQDKGQMHVLRNPLSENQMQLPYRIMCMQKHFYIFLEYQVSNLYPEYFQQSFRFLYHHCNELLAQLAYYRQAHHHIFFV